MQKGKNVCVEENQSDSLSDFADSFAEDSEMSSCLTEENVHQSMMHN